MRTQYDPKEIAPTIIVVFGATGDLMAKKIAPALFHLYGGKTLPERLRIVGVSRRGLSSQEFRDHVMEVLLDNADVARHKKSLSGFIKTLSYVEGDFNNAEAYGRLADHLTSIDDAWGMCSNKLFYLAVPPEHYRTIFESLSTSGLTEPCSSEEGWTRVVVEKPFGKDETTARELDALLGKLFRDVQVYRIDHYLGKEMLQNILSFRFANQLFSHAWDGDSIERIEIRLHEKDGIRARGEFYDAVGAFRDVGQNHLLQMLALVTMEDPGVFSAEAIRARRAEILRELRIMSAREVDAMTVRAQYKGYADAKGVAKDSATETFFRIETRLDTPRWRDVPIILESGKAMPEQKKEIVITFAKPQSALCYSHLPGQGTNTITFSMEPKESISVKFWGKKSGFAMDIEEKEFKFSGNSKDKNLHAGDYEKLLLDAIAGDQTLFVSTDEILSMWRFADAIVSAWEKGASPLQTYASGAKKDLVKLAASGAAVVAAPQSREIAMIGLGKMGSGLARQLARKGWKVAGFDPGLSDESSELLRREGILVADSLESAVQKLGDSSKSLRTDKKIVWLMVPAGKPVDDVLAKLMPLLSRGDVVIDGGNSFYKDSLAHAELLKKRGIGYLDVGTSGGPSGALLGASIMVGGDKKVFDSVQHLFAELAVRRGYQFFPGYGAGHFVKMVHNGIEYGMMQAIAEGFNVMRKSDFRLDLARVSDVYNHGSVVESRLIGWLDEAFDVYGTDLDGISGTARHTGEGEWTVQTAKELGLKTKVIEESLSFRKQSEKNPDYAGQILSALRNRFGGHSAK